MERLLVSIQERLANKVTELKTIDENWGQLNISLKDEDDSYPVIFPCALIDITVPQWETLSRNKQRGQATVEVTVAVDNYDDTHQSSGTNKKMIENRMVMRNAHVALANFAGHILPKLDGDGEIIEGEFIDNNFSGLQRISTQTKLIDGGIKAYIHTYTCTIYCDDAIPVVSFIPKPPLVVDSGIIE